MKCPGCGKETDAQGYCQECKNKLVPFYVNKIKSFIEAYDYKNALFHCGQALNIDPTASELLELEGEINRRLSEYQLCFSLGEENYNKGNYQKAAEFYQKALEINPLSQDLKMKLDMARISSQASIVNQPRSKKEAEEGEDFSPSRKISWKAIASFVLIGMSLFFLFRYFYASYLRMDAARSIFERISNGINDSRYINSQFIKDYEVLESKYRRTFYAQQAELLYGDVYKKAKGSKKMLAQAKKALQHGLGASVQKNEARKEQASSLRAVSKKEAAASKKTEGNKAEAEVLVRKARQYLAQGLYEKCLKALEKAVRIAPSDYSKALQPFRERVSNIIMQRKRRYLILVQEAHKLEEKGDFRSSLNYYYEALALRPHSKYCRMRIRYIKKKFLSSFFKEYAVRVSFFWRRLWHSRHKIIYLYKTSIERAERQRNFLKAALLYNNLAFITRKRFYRQKAVQELEMNLIEKKLRRGEVSSQLLIEKAVVYYKMHKFIEADKVLSNIILMNASSELYILASCLQAELWETKGEYFQAEKIFRTLLGKYSAPCFNKKIGMAVYRQGRKDEALKYLAGIPEAYLGLKERMVLADIYLHRGNKSAAQAVLKPLTGKSIPQLRALYKVDPLSFEFFSGSYQAKAASLVYALPSLFLRAGERAESLRLLALTS